MTSINSALTLLFPASGHSDRYTLIASPCYYGYTGLASTSDLFLSFGVSERASRVYVNPVLMIRERTGCNAASRVVLASSGDVGIKFTVKEIRPLKRFLVR